MQSKFDNDWNCPHCGELQSKHNMCLGEEGVCEECFTQILTPEENNYISSLTHRFKCEDGLKNISGAFCNVKPTLIDEKSICCNIEIGSCDEGGSYKSNFEIEIIRKDLTLKEFAN